MNGIERVKARIAEIEARYKEIVERGLGVGARFDALVKKAQACSIGGGPEDLVSIARETSERYGVDPGLVEAVVAAESGWNPNAVSKAGAQGLMQLMPGTAAGLGVSDPFDPAENLDAGVRLIRDLLTEHNGDLELALAAYNAGSARVRAYGGVPPFAETRNFVQKVLAAYEASRGG
jgi:soluble lytic murein transglycosylase-like protein